METNEFTNLLVKIPTRERGFDWLWLYLERAEHPGTRFLLSLDADDPQPVPFWLQDEERVTVVRGTSRNKIHAINRDINEYAAPWDVLLVGSDDMRPEMQGYDLQILRDCSERIPDRDGALWYPTEDSSPHIRGGQKMIPGTPAYFQHWICMLPVMTLPYYRRFGYVYHPSYSGFWCDNEYTDQARRLNRLHFVQRNLFRHLHPSWAAEGRADALYTRANASWQSDMNNFHRRKSHNYPA